MQKRHVVMLCRRVGNDTRGDSTERAIGVRFVNKPKGTVRAAAAVRFGGLININLK